MTHATTTSFTVHPFGGALGAEVRGIDLNEPLAREQVRGLRDAWAEHLSCAFVARRR